MTNIQMMSYIIRTPNGKNIVIDGGRPGDAKYLREKIGEYGNHVDMWLITHCHDDHFCALMEILKDQQDMTIEKIYYNFPTREWLNKIEPIDVNNEFIDIIESRPDLFFVVKQYDELEIDGINISVLNDPLALTKETDTKGIGINDTSVVFRFTFPNKKTALFLGDLGLRAGDLLEEEYGDELKSDIVQMAHHGQAGAGENVYKRIRPEVCMWAAPMWLWNNDAGKGFNTHTFKTVIVRGWMEKLGVKLHAIEGEGPAVII